MQALHSTHINQRTTPGKFRSQSARQRCSATPGSQPGLFRFWMDEKKFKGTGEDSIAQKTLLRLGGTRTGGHVKSAPTLGPLGWQVTDQWDILWSPSTPATQAAEAGLRPGQVTCAVPGSRCLTRKRMLTRTLRKAYGEDAFHHITPLTFELPGQLKTWLACMKNSTQPAAAPRTTSPGDAGSAGDGVAGRPAKPMWILKTAQNLGKGMLICHQREALKAVLVRTQAVKSATSLKDKKQLRPFVVVQRYVSDPLLITSRKFGIRVWALITSVDPLRLYLHTNGLVLFSNRAYHVEEPGDLQSHLTNYAQNVDGQVWSLEHLRSHLGHTQFDAMHASIQKITALTFAAGAAHMRQACQEARVPRGAAFEFFGLDFVIDAQLQPWLLEVNATPSLAVEHTDESVRQVIGDAKQGMLDDMFSLLRVPQRFSQQQQQQQQQAGKQEAQQVRDLVLAHCPAARTDEKVASHLVDTELELRHAGGWLPLTHLLPTASEAEGNGWTLELTQMDAHVQDWYATRQAAGASSATTPAGAASSSRSSSSAAAATAA